MSDPQELQIHTPSGTTAVMSYKDLSSIALPDTYPEMSQYMEKVYTSQISRNLLTNWFLGRCAHHQCTHIDGAKEIEEASITQSLSNLATDLGIKLRSLQNYRRLYLEYPDIDVIYYLASYGVSWTNFVQIIFPIPVQFAPLFLQYLLDYIDEMEVAPSTADMRKKAQDIIEENSVDVSSEAEDETSKVEVESDPYTEAITENVGQLQKAITTLTKHNSTCEDMFHDTRLAIDTMQDMELKAEDQEAFQEVVETYRNAMVSSCTLIMNMCVDTAQATMHKQSLAQLVANLISLAQSGGVNLQAEIDSAGRTNINVTTSTQNKKEA